MMETSSLFIVFWGLCSIGVLLSALLPDRRQIQVLTAVSSAASIVLLWASGRVLLFGHPYHATLWQIPYLGHITLHMDRLSALFVFVTGLVYLPVSIFSQQYMRKYHKTKSLMSEANIMHYSLKSFSAFYHLLFLSIVLTLVAGDVLSFLIAWEAMSILSYLLVNYEHKDAEKSRSAFLMLAMSEAGTLAAAIAFLILAAAAGKLDFASMRTVAGGLGEYARWAVFLLSFFGFGVKAGLVPTSTWLPRAHPAAPGNISALLSGVILNLGIYGIVRVNGVLLPVIHPGPGLIALIFGTLSALIGILYATTEDDMKKMLAHSSIENMGIIVSGLGAGFIFMAYNHPSLAGIAFIASFYHMINHSLYKALLFLGAGAVDSQAGTRDMNRLGGLIKRMPWTALGFLVGALSIAALPPFNGFVSEWLTLQTLLQSAALQSKGIKIIFALCGAGLALTAALAVTCFVKAFAMSFLGMSRSEPASKAVEPGRAMTFSMGFLAVLCFSFGILPTYVIPVLNRTISPLVGEDVVDELVPPFFTVGGGNSKFSNQFISEFHDLGAQAGRGILPGRGLVILRRGSERNPVVFAMSTSYTFIVLTLLLGGSALVIRLLTRRRRVRRQPVWDGGIRRLIPEMTYSATGFSNPVRVIFNAVFRPSSVEYTKEAIANHFRTAIRKESQKGYIVDKSFFEPIVKGIRRLASWLARMHSGRVNTYAAYILISLLLLLLVNWISLG